MLPTPYEQPVVPTINPLRSTCEYPFTLGPLRSSRSYSTNLFHNARNDVGRSVTDIASGQTHGEEPRGNRCHVALPPAAVRGEPPGIFFIGKE